MPFIPNDEHDKFEQPERIDWDEIDRNLAGNIESLLTQWFSDKKIKQSGGWFAIGNKGSLKVNAQDGHWTSHEDGTKGKGLLSLYAYRFNVTTEEAAEDLKSASNLVPFRKTRPDQPKAKPASQWEHADEPPDTYPDSHFENGKADHVYKYYDLDGKAIGIVLRWDKSWDRESSDCRPVSWIQMNGSLKPEWKFCAFQEPRPLYRGERLKKEPEKPVLIVEGEKCVEAAEKLLPDWIVISWPGGASAMKLANWDGLKGRKVVIWEDEDHKLDKDGIEKPLDEQPGHKSALYIKSQVPQAAIYRTDTGKDTYDIADAIEDGWTREMILKELNKMDALVPKIERGMDSMPLNFDEAKSLRPEVIMDGLLYSGSKMIVGGSAKAGKSHFVMDLVASLSNGQKFLKWKPQRQYKTLYVDFELHEWELRERSGRAFNWQIPDNFGRLSLRKHYDVRNPAALSKLFDAIDLSEWEVIILDCLYKFNQAEDENDNAQMQAICAWMDKIVVKYEVTPILIHHFGKGAQGNKSAIDRFRGASSLVGDMDAILSLTPHEEEGNVIIETEVRSFAPTESFVVRWDYPHFIIDESKDASKHAKPGAKKKMSDQDFLAQFPSEDQAKSKAEICQKLGISEATFRRRLSEFNEIKTKRDDSATGRPQNLYYVKH